MEGGGEGWGCWLDINYSSNNTCESGGITGLNTIWLLVLEMRVLVLGKRFLVDERQTDSLSSFVFCFFFNY